MAKKIKAETTFSLKDQLFNRKKIKYLSTLLKNSWSQFPEERFEKEILTGFSALELKERINRITDVLEKLLPSEFSRALNIILDSLPPPCDPTLSDNDFGDFIFEPLNQFVARHGVTKENLKRSLHALSILTQRFSAEYAIRPFLRLHEEETLLAVRRWAEDPHYHVRRLASEGIRPNLPWGAKVLLSPRKIINILDLLHQDSTRFVTRSVANNLNDISKYDPALVCVTLSRWNRLKVQRDNELSYITKHALRTLTKLGDERALEIQGILIKKFPLISSHLVPKRVTLGEVAHFNFELTSRENGVFLVDFVVHYPNGREKIFKGKRIELPVSSVVNVVKKIPFKPMTTRSLTEGLHHIQLQINGKRGEKFPFKLTL